MATPLITQIFETLGTDFGNSIELLKPVAIHLLAWFFAYELLAGLYFFSFSVVIYLLSGLLSFPHAAKDRSNNAVKISFFITSLLFLTDKFVRSFLFVTDEFVRDIKFKKFLSTFLRTSLTVTLTSLFLFC